MTEFTASDKNDPLFCGFTIAYFFATWGNVDFCDGKEEKSTEKWVVFIMPPTLLGGTTSETMQLGCTDRIVDKIKWLSQHSKESGAITGAKYVIGD